jgi:hypothetical protein
MARCSRPTYHSALLEVGAFHRMRQEAVQFGVNSRSAAWVFAFCSALIKRRHYAKHILPRKIFWSATPQEQDFDCPLTFG